IAAEDSLCRTSGARSVFPCRPGLTAWATHIPRRWRFNVAVFRDCNSLSMIRYSIMLLRYSCYIKPQQTAYSTFMHTFMHFWGCMGIPLVMSGDQVGLNGDDGGRGGGDEKD